MEELHFWAAKAKNLNSIFAQLQSDSIRIVLQYLDASKSTYNVPFAKLCKEVSWPELKPTITSTICGL
ncbi:hypothetical protein PC123_g28365 [Phytophthora cactorum]|nr:hypothetical protein PC123_g28365 [Phytophthora cactorum]